MATEIRKAVRTFKYEKANELGTWTLLKVLWNRYSDLFWITGFFVGWTLYIWNRLGQ